MEMDVKHLHINPRLCSLRDKSTSWRIEIWLVFKCSVFWRMHPRRQHSVLWQTRTGFSQTFMVVMTGGNKADTFSWGVFKCKGCMWLSSGKDEEEEKRVKPLYLEHLMKINLLNDNKWRSSYILNIVDYCINYITHIAHSKTSKHKHASWPVAC